MAVTIDTFASTALGSQYSDLKTKITTVRSLVDSTCSYLSILDDLENNLDVYYDQLAAFVGESLDFLQDTANCIINALGKESSDSFTTLKENLVQSMSDIINGIVTSDFYQDARVALDSVINSTDPCAAINDYLASIATNLTTLVSNITSKMDSLNNAKTLRSTIATTISKTISIIKCTTDLTDDVRFRGVLQIVDPQIDTIISSVVDQLEYTNPEQAVLSTVQAQLDVPTQLINLASELLL